MASKDDADVNDDGAKSNERRHFFRLDDDVIFEYRPISDDDDAADFGKDEPIISCMHILDDIREIDALGQPALQRIAMHNPSIADYFRVNNKKIEMLTRFLTEELLAKFVLRADERETQTVNISAGGIAFNTNEALAVNSLVKVKTILLPTYDCILATAVVVGCKQEEDSFRISSKFLQLADVDEQKIIRHIYSLQLKQHQQNKEKNKKKS